MKSFTLLSASLLLFFTNGSYAQKITEGHWGQAGYDVAYSAAATNDGGYIITGLSQSGVEKNGDIIVIKTNSAGDTMWTFGHGGPELEGGNNVIQTSDGGYMVSGHTEDFGAQDCDAFLMKLDKNGKYEWLKIYGGPFDDICNGTIELPDGYIFAGITASYGNGGLDGKRHVYIVRTNSTGEAVWTKYYAGTGAEYTYSIAAMQNGGFLAVGYTTSFGNGEADGWLLRLKDNGDTLWTRRYHSPGNSRLYKIIPTIDNNFIITGFTTPSLPGNPQGLAIKLDAEGKELWMKTYSNSKDTLMLRDVAQLPNGNLMFTGTSCEHDPQGNIYVLTTDADGNKITDELCGGSNSAANTIAVQGNNGCLIAGIATKYGDVNGDIYYRETDNTNAGIPSEHMTVPHMYPNPINGQNAVVVLPASEAYQTVRVEVINSTGKIISSRENILAKDIVIDRGQWPAGQYTYRIQSKDGKTFKGKFIVE